MIFNFLRCGKVKNNIRIIGIVFRTWLINFGFLWYYLINLFYICIKSISKKL